MSARTSQIRHRATAALIDGFEASGYAVPLATLGTPQGLKRAKAVGGFFKAFTPDKDEKK